MVAKDSDGSNRRRGGAVRCSSRVATAQAASFTRPVSRLSRSAHPSRDELVITTVEPARIFGQEGIGGENAAASVLVLPPVRSFRLVGMGKAKSARGSNLFAKIGGDFRLHEQAMGKVPMNDQA